MSNLTKEHYQNAIKKCVDYIAKLTEPDHVYHSTTEYTRLKYLAESLIKNIDTYHTLESGVAGTKYVDPLPDDLDSAVVAINDYSVNQ